MTGERVLVTGGTGFLGRHLVNQLIGQGYQVRLLVRETSDISWLDTALVDLVYGNVTDSDSVDHAVEGCEYIIHAAGFFRLWGPHEVFDSVNVDGTVNVANAALKYGVKRMIHVSSIAVVGHPAPGQIIDEHTLCTPQSPYQHSKLTAEHRLNAMQEKQGLPVIILRPGAFYGPGSTYGFNHLFVFEPMHGWRVKVEHGNRLTFPAFVPDVAKTIITSLHKGRLGALYNVSGVSRTHNDVNEIVNELLGISSWRLNVARYPMILLAALQELVATITRREPYYPLNLRHYVFNDWDVRSDRAIAELDFVPTPFEEGLRQTIEWIKAQE